MNRPLRSTKLMVITAMLVMLASFGNLVAGEPLKVFILAGQSNMQGHARATTFDSMATDPLTAPILKEIRNADGTPRVCQKVWISSVGSLGDAYSDFTSEQKGLVTVGFGPGSDKFGPEFTFGIYMEKILGKPILIIKTAWGGRDLNTEFRSPGDWWFEGRRRTIELPKSHGCSGVDA